MLDARAIACPEALRQRPSSRDDPATLPRWVTRATSASSAAEAFDES